MKNFFYNPANTNTRLAVLISVMALMMFVSMQVNAQNTNLYVTTETHINGKAYKGYMVTVYEDLLGNGDFSPIDQFMATSSKNRFDMKYNSAYMIDFATPADLHYTVQFDTHTAKTSEDRDFEIDVDFSKLDVNEYPNTIEMVTFNDEEQNFAFKPLVDSKVQQAAVK
ncbi:MAG: hypothetical protein AB7G44_07835 [Bacteroidia bacterium]